MVMVSKYWACLSARLMRGPKVEEVVNISMFLREKQPLIYIYIRVLTAFAHRKSQVPTSATNPTMSVGSWRPGILL